jgi:hypothetical protein
MERAGSVIHHKPADASGWFYSQSSAVPADPLVIRRRTDLLRRRSNRVKTLMYDGLQPGRSLPGWQRPVVDFQILTSA